MRVIYSTVQSANIDDEQEDDFYEAVSEALGRSDQARETFTRDEIGQKAHQIALLPYTDPNGERRWAVTDSGPGELDWQDTDDLDEANAAYEEAVRGATRAAGTKYDDEGEEQPTWDETDVDGVSARDMCDGGLATARLTDAQWAHDAFVQAEKAYQEATRRRQQAFALAVDSHGRGGQALLAVRFGMREPTVKTLVTKGRRLLAQSHEKTDG